MIETLEKYRDVIQKFFIIFVVISCGYCFVIGLKDLYDPIYEKKCGTITHMDHSIQNLEYLIVVKYQNNQSLDYKISASEYYQAKVGSEYCQNLQLLRGNTFIHCVAIIAFILLIVITIILAVMLIRWIFDIQN